MAGIMLISCVFFGCYYHVTAKQEAAPVNVDEPLEIEDVQELLAKKELLISPATSVKGYYLSGRDIVQKKENDAQTITARIDAIFDNLNKMDFNTILFDAEYEGQVLYRSELYQHYGTDVLELLKERADQKGIYLFAVYRLSGLQSASEEPVDPVEGARELAEQYELDGILLDQYYKNAEPEQYFAYMATGGGSGYEEWMRNTTASLIDDTVTAIRDAADYIPVGLLADPVWAYKSTLEGGIDTKSGLEAYQTGHADTKALVENKTVDFVCVRAENSLTDPNLSFTTVLNWWSAVAKGADVPLYLLHAGENVCTSKAGWNGVDQLARQVSQASKAAQYAGSFFSGYDTLAADVQGATSALLKFYANEYKDENLFQDLVLTSPSKTSVTTYEGSIVFAGKYDPQQDVTINDVKINPNKQGEFQKKYDLEIGTTKFVVKHKGQVKTYSVTRKVKVFQSVYPTGTLKVDGETSINISAMAYRGAKVTATFNGKTITLAQADESEGVDTDSIYTMYVGRFTAPKAGDKDKSLGKIKFSASYKNSSETKNGASITLLKKISIPNWSGDPSGSVIQPINPTMQARVITDYLEVYNPADTDPYPSAIYYSPPKGTIDYIDSQRTIGSKTFYYLHSGKRVLSTDVQVFTGTYNGNNALSGVEISEEELYTTLKIKQKWNAPFNITFNNLNFYSLTSEHTYDIKSFDSDTVTITFDYATQAEAVSKELLDGNSMFSDIRWEKTIEYGVDRYKLHLKLIRPGKYFGCYSYYEGDTLVLKFNRFEQSLKGMRIFLDPGHGGSDSGAVHRSSQGDYIDAYEKDINLDIVKKLKEKLEAEGAVVEYLTEEQRQKYAGSNLAGRYKEAQNYKANLFLSVHCNSSTASATGTEAWYTAPFSMPLAKEIAAGISAQTGLKNRGFKNNRFAVNRGRTFPSVLIETAFISNSSDLKLLNTEEGQDKIATGIVNGIKNYIK